MKKLEKTIENIIAVWLAATTGYLASYAMDTMATKRAHFIVGVGLVLFLTLLITFVELVGSYTDGKKSGPAARLGEDAIQDDSSGIGDRDTGRGHQNRGQISQQQDGQAGVSDGR